MNSGYKYLKFIWEYKAVILPLFLWLGVILDYAHVSLVVPTDYVGISYSVEINATEIARITMKIIRNTINHLGDYTWNI